SNLSFEEIKKLSNKSALRCADEAAEKLMRDEIDTAKSEGDTLGGVFEIIIKGHPIGLGSHVHWDRKIDARLAYAVMSIQAVKGVEIGAGFTFAKRRGSKVHDAISYKNGAYTRKTNNAGGIEGGMTNGEPIILRACMKPISTLSRPLESVDVNTKKPTKATVERSDVCAVPSAGVISENVSAFVMADLFLEKFGGDSLEETKEHHRSYIEMLQEF
ncbi:MAG: chorismate synthase, partial [Candidatus Omnitrophica bacterium]|nr:chorismate synthase [Candidatus Omnitrophota bacterium]